MISQVDYIIVGQGIAGSMVAYFLQKKGKTILVLDEFNPNSSSNIAAGIVNPITGRKMVKTWLIDEVLPFAKEAYQELEKSLQVSFFYEKEIYKIFTSADDEIIWNKKKSEDEYQQYLGDVIRLDHKFNNVSAPFGAGVIRQSCWLDVPEFTKVYRSLLKKGNRLLEEKFDFSLLDIKSGVRYKEVSAKGIIFCEGYKAIHNPFFKGIPFSLAKGEQLLILAEQLKSEDILSRNIFVIPKNDNLYSVGSTFIWDDTEESVTDAGREEITKKFERIFNGKYTVIEEKAGIRPAMPDRRPVIGRHPEHPNIFIFNGMGTKGVSLSPYFAHKFAGFLDNNYQIPNEISINRFVV